jgi:predicted alpha/beta hydrolase
MATRGGRQRRPVTAPRASFEELEIRTGDGVSLRAVLDDPPEGVALRGTCVLAHAMASRKTAWGRRERPGLAQAYARAGWRTIAFDFRGHGDSTAVRDWGYDDLVRFDLPAVVGCARTRSEPLPVVVVGHAMGAHVALAAQGTGRLRADGLVLIGCSLWVRQLEPSRVRGAVARALGRALEGALGGGVPARRLRLGSDDVSGRFAGDLLRFSREESWRSEDGADDYLASLARVVVPVAAVSSDGDRWMCPPASAERLARRCAGPVEVVRLRASDDGGRAPGHRTMVTTNAAERPLLDALAWIASTLTATDG